MCKRSKRLLNWKVNLLLPHPQRGDKRFLRDAHIAIFPHPCLAFFLLFQQFLLTADVAAIAFGGHVLAHCGDGFAGDDFAADGRLHGDFEQMARDQVF